MSYKIIIFSESLPNRDHLGAYAYSFGLSLAEQQHEVKIISSRGAVFARPDRCNTLQILYPLKNWSPLELLKVIPLLLEFQPQVIFFSQPHLNKSLINLFHLLPHALPMINTPLRILSLFDLSDHWNWKKSLGLMNSCDLVTVLSSPQRDLILKQNRLRPNLRIEILPSYLPFEAHLSDHPPLPNRFNRPYMLIPGPISLHHDLVLLFQILQASFEAHPKLSIVFCGSWDETNVELKRKLLRPLVESGFIANLMFTGAVTDHQFLAMATNAKVLFGSTLYSSGALILEMLHLARWFHKPVIITDHLASQHSIIETTSPFCFVAPPTPRLQVQALSAALNSYADFDEFSLKRPPESYKISLDAIGNALNRLLMTQTY